MTYSNILPLFGDRTIDQFRGEHTFLSNFYDCEIIFEGQTYSSTEHAYVAAKTLDPAQREEVRNRTAGQAKRYGRDHLTLREDWEEVKLGIMEDLIRQKFSVEPLRTRLLDTGTSQLVEGNWWNDRFWGVDLETGIGKNHLGKILMEIRTELHYE